MAETIGQQLKQAREAHNFTIEKVVEATRLRAHYIAALEADDFESLPSPVQARAFLRIYAEFLGVSLADLIAHQRAGAKETAAPSLEPEAAPAQMQVRDEEPASPVTPVSAPKPIFAFVTKRVSVIWDKVKGFLAHLKERMPRLKRPSASAQLTTPAEAVKEESEETSQKENAQPVAPVAKPVDAPVSSKLSIIKDKIKKLFTKLKQSIPWPKKPPASEEAASGQTNETAEEKTTEESIPNTPTLETAVDKEEVTLPLAESPSEPSETQESRAIFASIGKALRQRRESLSLTLDEIEYHIHVRQHYLQALEGGDFDRLPSSVQARGMLNNYARFLDMDVDAILLQFAEGLQRQRLERQPNPAEKSSRTAARASLTGNLPPGLRRFLSMDVLVGGGLILVLLIFAIWGTTRIVRLHSASSLQPTALSISHFLANTPEASTATSMPESEGEAAAIIPTASETVAVTIQASGQGTVQVVVVAQESAWVRVAVDGEKQFEGRVNPGNAYSYSGNTRVEVLTGNGAAVSILYNEGDLGPMGAYGEVVDRIYTADSILIPTATSTPTPTTTLEPSNTPRPSSTLQPSITPRFSLTPTP